MTEPFLKASEFLESLPAMRRSEAKVVVEDVLAWALARNCLLRYNAHELKQPRIRFDLASGAAFLIVGPGASGDGKVELLTRTLRNLPAPILAQLKSVLGNLVPPRVWQGDGVCELPLGKLANPSERERFRAGLDLALGAAAASASALSDGAA